MVGKYLSKPVKFLFACLVCIALVVGASYVVKWLW